MLSLCHLLVPCYVFFQLGSLPKSVMYGLGRTDVLVACSTVGNVYLVTLFLLLTYGVIPVSIHRIIWVIIIKGALHGCHSS